MELNAIVILDDDEDDLEMIEKCWKELKITRPIVFFKSGNDLMDYLRDSVKPPYFILSDVNLYGETGFDVRKRIAADPELKYKSMPFLFWSTSASEKQIQHAYDLPAQGFFVKPSNFAELCNTFEIIMDYWQTSQHPKQLH